MMRKRNPKNENGAVAKRRSEEELSGRRRRLYWMRKILIL
jgi:hypothetical protein